MPLQISWRNVSEIHTIEQQSLAVFGAELVLTLAGDVIIDTNWVVSGREFELADTDLGRRIQRFLVHPDGEILTIALQSQGSSFCNGVWSALMEIPLGQVLSYAELARQLGSAPRAVAQACRKNPYPGIIPCHRVVATSGIGGFMGQAHGDFVEFKRRILACEREIVGEVGR